jgi:hypothetical protein
MAKWVVHLQHFKFENLWKLLNWVVMASIDTTMQSNFLKSIDYCYDFLNNKGNYVSTYNNKIHYILKG